MRYIVIHSDRPSELRSTLRQLLGKFEGRLAWLKAATSHGIYATDDYELVLVNPRTAVLRIES